MGNQIDRRKMMISGIGGVADLNREIWAKGMGFFGGGEYVAEITEAVMMQSF
jgi:hypothetical protein